MECGDIIGWDTLLRLVSRVLDPDNGTNSIALDLNAPATDPLPCVRGGVLTDAAALVYELGGASLVRSEYATDGEVEHLTCDDLEIPLTTLLEETLLQSDNGLLIRVWEGRADNTPLTCDMASIGLESLIRGTFITMSNGERRVRIWGAPFVANQPTCDLEEIPFESLVRRAIVVVGPNQFAWRYVQEA